MYNMYVPAHILAHFYPLRPPPSAHSLILYCTHNSMT